MRWCHAGTGVLLLMLLAGCPSGFGKDGRIDRAVHQDMLELTRKHCTPEDYDQFCGGDKRYTEECRKQCGG